jgi:hypothetical protein
MMIKRMAIKNNTIPPVRNLRKITVRIEISANNPFTTIGIKLQKRFAMTMLKISLFDILIGIVFN